MQHSEGELVMRCLALILITFGLSTPVRAVDLTPAQIEQMCINTTAETVPGSGDSWGCYDPLPAHPTVAERTAFIAEISGAALAAEVKYGVPAPALIAMALAESGAGLTRMPLCSNNLFGWKWYSAVSAGNRPYFTLGCQPAWDDNNRYVKFVDRADSIDFVAMKLATLSYYKPDTDAFKQSYGEGADRRRAIRNWLTGIANPYNYDPDKYVRTIERLMNDPITPSDTLNPDRTLYAVAPASDGAVDSARAAIEAMVAAIIQKRFDAGRRYVVGVDSATKPHQNCKDLTTELLQNELVKPYAGVLLNSKAKLLECIHKASEGDTSRQGWTIVLADTADNIAKRIVGACAKVAPQKLESCAMKMSSTGKPYPWHSNSYIFPVTGFVFEGPGNCKGGGGKAGLIGFRHGVTVQYGEAGDASKKLTYCVTDVTDIATQRQIGLSNPTYAVYDIGRIAAVDRDNIPDHSFPDTKPLSGLTSDSFQNFVQENEIKAVETGEDFLMEVMARALRGNF